MPPRTYGRGTWAGRLPFNFRDVQVRMDRNNPYPSPTERNLEHKIQIHLLHAPVRCATCNGSRVLPFKVEKEFDCADDRYIFNVYFRCTLCRALYTKRTWFPRSKYLRIDDFKFKSLGKMYKVECQKNKHVYG